MAQRYPALFPGLIRLASHHLNAWLQAYRTRRPYLSPTQAQPGSPDDDTLVLFGIKHFGEGEISNCKEVPGETGRYVALSLTVSFHRPKTARGWGRGTSVQPSSQCCPPFMNLIQSHSGL